MDADKVVKALSEATFAVPDIMGPLHALHYYGHQLDVSDRAIALMKAREATERLLASIVAAEQSIAPPAKSEPSNVVQIGDHDPELNRQMTVVSTIMGGDAA